MAKYEMPKNSMTRPQVRLNRLNKLARNHGENTSLIRKIQKLCVVVGLESGNY